MIKVYVPNISKTSIGGGFRFCENFKKALIGRVEFVNKWEDAHIIFIFGITTINKGEIHDAVNAGKKLVLRVDNVPRKSRNHRQSPANRLGEFGNKASMVVYQSEWCKKYAGYFIKNANEIIINNGVDTSIFNEEGRKSDGYTYLYMNYNDNPNKRFDEALYRFDMDWREDNEKHLIIAGNIPKVYLGHSEYNFDIPSEARVDYIGVLETPEKVVEVMKICDYLLYPSFAEAYPNTLLEAIACGLKPLHVNSEGGAREVIKNNYKEVKTIQEMADEYYAIFIGLINIK